MKKIMVTSIALMLAISVNAQKMKQAAIPKAVTDAFAENFKGAKAEAWIKEKDGNYEAEFDWNKIESSATFTAAGKLLETEQEISIKSLPKAVTDYAAKNYAGYKIVEAAKITDADKKIMYEAEVKKGKEGFDLIFDSSGTFIKKVVMTKENDKK